MTISRRSVTDNKEWCTPPEYVEAVREVLGDITLDPCSNEHSIVGAKEEYRLPEKDGIKESWDYPTIFVNPPYGRDTERGTSIKDWIERCSLAREEYNSEVIALIPVATNTTYWHQYVFPTATSICFLKVPRLKFILGGEKIKKGAPMACCFVYWGGYPEVFEEVFGEWGKVVRIQKS